MVDFLSKAERSTRMSRIGRKNTKPELVLRKRLHRAGFRYKLHERSLPGTPDIVLPKFCAVIFVHGCFWHRHVNCKVASDPKSNVEFWRRKFIANVSRDKINQEMLAKLGWRVFVVWECQLAPKFVDETVACLIAGLKGA